MHGQSTAAAVIDGYKNSAAAGEMPMPAATSVSSWLESPLSPSVPPVPVLTDRQPTSEPPRSEKPEPAVTGQIKPDTDKDNNADQRAVGWTSGLDVPSPRQSFAHEGPFTPRR